MTVTVRGQDILFNDGTTQSTASGINSKVIQNTTSGSFVDFTGIPAGTKRITVLFRGVSLNDNSNCLIQLGSSGIVSSGYVSYGATAIGGASSNGYLSTNGFIMGIANAAIFQYGIATICNMDSNVWVSTSCVSGIFNNIAISGTSSGSIELSGVLDAIRITNTGSATFDAGSINVLYE